MTDPIGKRSLQELHTVSLKPKKEDQATSASLPILSRLRNAAESLTSPSKFKASILRRSSSNLQTTAAKVDLSQTAPKLFAHFKGLLSHRETYFVDKEREAQGMLPEMEVLISRAKDVLPDEVRDLYLAIKDVETPAAKQIANFIIQFAPETLTPKK